jgi:class 3 adenylate cyclase
MADQPVLLGSIHLGLSEELIARQITSMRNRLALIATIGLLIGGGCAYLLAGVAVRPVHLLVDGVKAVGTGNLQQHIELRRSDELGILTNAFNDMTASLREKEFIKSTLERYVSKPLAQQILQHRNELQLGGEEREVTVLFCDIRRFTSLAEQLPPTAVVQLLNDYFTRMIQVVSTHDGMVDKLMGDSVMALFGAPLAFGDEPYQAVKCAVEMQQAVAVFNAERKSSGLPPLEMGIGINTGPVVAGNIGSATRMEYTVIGDNVNIAARLQGMARQGEVLISGATFERLGDRVTATQLEPITLKGKSKQVVVYRIDALRQS